MGGAVGRGLTATLPGVPAAEEYLSFAFQHCHRSSQRNKRLVLIYLLPVKMLLVRAAPHAGPRAFCTTAAGGAGSCLTPRQGGTSLPCV